jgi:SAM-dependent methyltransferase
MRNLGPLMKWACDVTAIGPGDRVLDIGTGTGQPALSAAQRVKPSGSVVAVDISPEMLASAQQRATKMGLHNIEFREMDAQELALDDESFDAVTFICGLMFCHDPVRAAAEIRRVLRPGGRFAIAVWDEPSFNPFISLLAGAVGKVIQMPPPDPRAPGGFRLAKRDDLAGVLSAAGFSQFEIASRTLKQEYASVDDYIAVTTDFMGGVKAKLAALPADDWNRFVNMVREGAAPYMEQGLLKLPATPLCAWGRA